MEQRLELPWFSGFEEKVFHSMKWHLHAEEKKIYQIRQRTRTEPQCFPSLQTIQAPTPAEVIEGRGLLALRLWGPQDPPFALACPWHATHFPISLHKVGAILPSERRTHDPCSSLP